MAHPQFTLSQTESGVTPRHPPSPIDGSYIAVPIRRRGGAIAAWTLVDLEDLDIIGNWKWSLVGRKGDQYPGRGENGQTILLHRELLKLPRSRKESPLQADHKDRDHMNNRKYNLRVVTHAQNAQNHSKHKNSQSRFRGVSWHSRTKKWRATIWHKGKNHQLGVFLDEEEAAQAAREARQLLMPYAVD